MKKIITVIFTFLLMVFLAGCEDNVPKVNYEEIFGEVEIGFTENNDSKSSVTNDLILPKEVSFDNVSLEWKSLNQEIISNEGIVNRPLNDTIVSIELNVITEYSNKKDVRDVLVKGIGEELLDELAIEYLDLDHKDSVTQDVILKTETDFANVKVEWQSSDETIITNDGKVLRQADDKLVTLTLNITKGSEKLTKEFLLNVLAKETEQVPVINDVTLEGIALYNKDFSNNEYYLDKATNFDLHIYLINENDFEITGIIINDKLYFSSDFNLDSTNQEIFITLNSGNNVGLNEFKVSQILYNDNGVTSSVSINGNNIIKVFIAASNLPKVIKLIHLPDLFTNRITINLEDRESLIDFSNDNVTLTLYDEGMFVSETVISKLTETIDLITLKINHQYSFNINVAYDKYDGNGIIKDTVYTGTFKTKGPFEVTQRQLYQDKIDFNIIKLVDEVNLDKIELFLNTTYIKDIDINTNSITNLTPDKTYQLILHYNYNLIDEPGINIKDKQIVELKTIELVMTDVIRNGTTVPFTGGGNVKIPNYIEPSSELRAVWVATVANIDIGKLTTTESYKNTIRNILNNVKAANMNAVFFQIRPMNDAWYESDLAPWSRYITGIEGRNPGFDVLEFVITEAHARGIELHGWLNPYRVANSATTLENMHESNFAYGREDLWLQGGNQTILDPGIPEVQEYIVDVIDEIITKYPTINGIHFDDYFYLDQTVIGENSSSPDYNTWQTYGKNKSFDQFRRDSVTTIIRNIYNNVEVFNALNGTSIKFGISPSGIWANKGSNAAGSDTTGWQHLYALHADTKAWIDEGIIHYIVPQIYWDFDLRAARYANLVDWWARTVRGTGVDLIIGMGPYRIRPDANGKVAWPIRALEEQLRFNQLYSEVVGSSLYSYQDIVSIHSSVRDAFNIVKNDLWRNPVEVPWETNIYND